MEGKQCWSLENCKKRCLNMYFFLRSCDCWLFSDLVWTLQTLGTKVWSSPFASKLYKRCAVDFFSWIWFQIGGCCGCHKWKSALSYSWHWWAFRFSLGGGCSSSSHCCCIQKWQSKDVKQLSFINKSLSHYYSQLTAS